MIVQCKKCKVQYNNQTVNYCPQCNIKAQIREEYIYNGEAQKTKQIWQFKRESINSKIKSVNSLRSNQRINYERKTGKKIGGTE